MQRAQIYLTENHRDSLAAVAHARGTTQSALIREALDAYLLRQAPLEKRAMRSSSFGAWAKNDDAPSLKQLRAEERRF